MKKLKKFLLYAVYTLFVILVCYICSKQEEISQYSVAQVKDSKKISSDDAILLFNGDEYVKYKLEDTTYVSASTMIGYVKKNSYEDYLPNMFKPHVKTCYNDEFQDFIEVSSIFDGCYLFVNKDRADRMEQEGFLRQDSTELNWDKAVPTTIRVNNYSITSKEDIEYLLSVECGAGQNVRFKSQELDGYTMRVYYNDTPISRFITSIYRTSDKYIYPKHNKNDYTYGKVIEDESRLESIKVDGVQVFRKNMEGDIDNIEYLND